MKPVDPPVVLDQFDEGVAQIILLAGEREGRAWHKTVVGDWSAHELARHLLAVSDWYHEWLDRAEAGDSTPPFPAKQLDSRNELAVLELGRLDGPEAIAKFAVSVTDYRRRLEQLATDGCWDLPYGFANGRTTAGGHAGIAAAEWHLHAWDLSGGRWRPSSPQTLYLAVGHGMVATQPRWKQPITRRVVARIAAGDPWADLVKRSGRVAPDSPSSDSASSDSTSSD